MTILYKIIATAGKFDPLYPRDIKFLKYARSLGDELIVIAYNDYLISHKVPGLDSIVGKDISTRINQLEDLECVDVVVSSHHGQMHRIEPYTQFTANDYSVGYEMQQLKPYLFITNSNETFKSNKEICEEMNINIKFCELGEYDDGSN